MSMGVQVDRAITIKVKGQTIELNDEEARELVRQLSDALPVAYVPWEWWRWSGFDDDGVWHYTTDDPDTTTTDTTTDTIIEIT